MRIFLIRLNEKAALSLKKIWLYSKAPFNDAAVKALKKPDIKSDDQANQLLGLLLLYAGLIDDKNKGASTIKKEAKEEEEANAVVNCGRCRTKCKWISKYYGTYMDYGICDKCKKNVYGLRFNCIIHDYNVCYSCSIIGQTKKTCGCFGSLKKGKYPCFLCICCSQQNTEGFTCVQGCQFYMCVKCCGQTTEIDFFNRYKFDAKELLGKGGFGEVFKGMDTISKEVCAVKLINLHEMNPNQRAKCLVEIDIMKQLKHPSIILFKDSVFTKDDKLYIAMTLADGGDLSKLISQRKEKKAFFEEKFIINMMLKVCEALRFLHVEKKMIHRDLKPQNILLTKDQKVKLADFGLAYDFNSHFDHLAQTMCGSPLYISPEILDNKDYDYKTDVWSVGCILAEMASLTYTFYGGSLAAIFELIKAGKYNPVPSKYSKGLRDLVAGMICVDKAKRFDIVKVIADLNNILSKLK